MSNTSINTTLPKTLTEAILHFADWENCRNYMVSRRWPNGITCPVCRSKKVYFDKSRPGWECKTRHPKRKFTLKTGTIFEDSALGLDKWLPTVWLIASCKNGISSHEIARAIGVTQKTAWFMLHRIRLAMQDDDTGGTLGGEVEVDETFIGGKARNMHKSRKARTVKGRALWGKTAVIGLLERHGRDGHSTIRTRVIGGRRRKHVETEVLLSVEPGATVYTDELKSYDDLSRAYTHEVINHAETYVDGQIHTNGCENYWSLLKRGLNGTYVSVEPFHLFRYLDEQAFRFNTRKDTDADRFRGVIDGIVGRRLTHATLTGSVGEHVH